jgi:uncharacterized protein (TIGR00725 family)
MKICVCGSGRIFDKEVAKKAAAIGKEIASKGHVLLTGGCNGYPNEAAKAAFENKGEVIGYSPASDKEEHVAMYGFPTANFTELIYTGKGIPGRNEDLVKEADAVIVVDGKIGTLNEFTIAFHYEKKIGVLKHSGGISDVIPAIAEKIDKSGEKDNIVYSDRPKELVLMLVKD